MANIREWVRWAWSDDPPRSASKKAGKEPMSAKARMGAVLIGAVVGFIGFALAEAGSSANSTPASAIGGWLLILGGLFALVNLVVAGWRLMRDG